MSRNNRRKHLELRCFCILLTCIMLTMSVFALKVQATEELTNFAASGTASMNYDCYQHETYGNHPASDAIDGNMSTYAQSAEKGQVWDLTVDLGEAKTIRRFNVIVGYNNRATAYTICYSNDGENWTEAATVATVQFGQSSPYPDNISELDEPVTARYFKIDVTSVTEKDSAHSIREFEIWGVDATDDNPVELTNLAPLSGVAANMNGGIAYTNNPASKAIDGDVGTYAQANTKGAVWDLEVDLGSAREIYKFNVIVGYNNRATAYTIYYSNDGENWTEATTVTNVQFGQSSPYPDNVSELADPVTARYLKVDVTSVTEKDSAHSIREFEIWGIVPENEEDGEEEADTLFNLSLLSTVTMDQESYAGNENHPVELAIDGDPATYAQSMQSVSVTNVSWNLMVDLNGTQEIHKFRVLTGNTCRATAYELQTSSDGQNWETVATVTDAQQGGSSSNWTYNETVLDNPVQAAYVRLYVTSSVDNNDAGHSVREFEILGKVLDYGDLGGCEESQLGTAISSNIAVTTISSNSVNKDNITDGDTSTSWTPDSSDTSPCLILDTARAHDFSGIQIQYAGEVAVKYVVYTSEDNIRWYKEAEVSVMGTTHNFLHNQLNRRYVRLDMFFLTGTKGICEIDVYGKETVLADVPTVMETFGSGSTYERDIIIPKASNVAGVTTNAVNLNGAWYFCLYPELGYWEADSSREGWTTVTLPGDAETQGYIRYYLATQSATEFESAFERTITIPEDFEGERVILRLKAPLKYLPEELPHISISS